jgi:Uncharacterized protein with SCP/PR1 domains
MKLGIDTLQCLLRQAAFTALAAVLLLPGCFEQQVVSSRPAPSTPQPAQQPPQQAQNIAGRRASRLQVDLAESRRAFTLVNQERLKIGLPPLMRRADLDEAARLHALDQVRMNKLSHFGTNGSQITNRLAHIPWINAGENLARNKGFNDPSGEAIRGWLASPSHRSIMLSTDFSYCGMAVVRDPETDFIYFVQVFINPGSF